eukprot:TRINITY_DN3276_c0_g1_i1.p1 TRINITY_DN3276_c0_g1~~TRINITY_DN3276_c0_g1_i1.p1  ORF type:complete len:104 (-),score=23.89 TRINITY_DN3276_c0_g1_i1:88-399(-)
MGRKLSEGAQKRIEEAKPIIDHAYALHTNDMENLYVFFTLGLLYSLTNPSETIAKVLFYGFTFARILHTFSFLFKLQPWRALTYLVGFFINVYLAISVLRNYL